MKAMPLPFEDFQGKGVLDFSSSFSSSSPDLLSEKLFLEPQNLLTWQNSKTKENFCYVGSEPTSVLDARRSPSPPTSSSTLSSSQGGAARSGGGGGGSRGGASTETTTNSAGVAAVENSAEKCGQKQQLGMEDWEGVLPTGSPNQEQEQSILRLIMGDIEDPSLGLNKLLHSGTGSSHEMEFNAGFGVVDQGFGFEPINCVNLINCIDPAPTSSEFPLLSHNARIGSVLNQTHNPNPGNNLFPGVFNHHPPPPVPPIEVTEEKPQIFNSQVIINQNQAHFNQNPAMFLPFSYAQLQEHHQNLLSPPPPKRLNLGPVGGNFQVQNQFQMLQQRPNMMKQKIMTDELAAQQLEQALINPICQAAELIETGNPVLAQGILARLNHQLSLSIGKPHIRAAFYFKEALQLLLHMTTTTQPNPSPSPCNLIFKIGAFKSFSEISPILQFSNFTCNQALLESCDGSDRIHIFDFDIGFGGQWASFMQELALRNGNVPSLKITAFGSAASHDEIELRFTQENLKMFASEINMPFEIEILSLESLNSGPWPLPIVMSEKEVVCVNLPIAPFSNYPSYLPLVLRFVKQLSPKIVVSLDRGCDRTDLSLAHHVNYAIQSYSGLLESLEAVNMNIEALQKIERFLIQPAIEKIVVGRHHHPERTPPWRSLFLQSGFTPFQFSNFAESQAECLVQRTPVRGFHVEKRQSSLVLCWQRKELVSASAWRC
ncbi:scarecrow-like protein 6 [Mercurialis annua]|uniref:scarecrow-like protein 6 n=1 Tax=Mercurialis annua TaxID=3986 RepID=UPI00215F2571|nr:scarecrow-like protein 6 [Mercurialis annua]